METMEEARGSSMSSNSNNNEGLLPIVKGKRTKRHRGSPPATAASSTSSSGLSGATTEEEEDMANCLILLAQGGTSKAPEYSPAEDSGVVKQEKEKFTSRKLAETATATDGKAGFYVYECKTCNKCFPSFQALGGHRASHKKPKLAPPVITADEKKPPANDEDSNNNLQISMNSFYKPVVATSRPRVHECSICGSEFSSGQALGGHMRRHRPLDVQEPSEIKRERTGLLSLDLNLPAPSEDSPSINPFPLAFSVSALVDCHY